MIKKSLLILIIISLIPLYGCGRREFRFTMEFYGTFDTVVQIIAYAETEEDFDAFSKEVHSEMLLLHKLFDIYHDYQGLTNLKSVNDSAGASPVKVEPDIIELLLFAKDCYEKSGGSVDITMGPVLKIWHEYRMQHSNGGEAALPAMESLDEAAALRGIDDVIIDSEKNEVFLKRTGMSLDVGALAKGYAIQRAADSAEGIGGITSFLINGGGNVLVRGTPPDGRSGWGVGVQEPDGDGLVASLYISDRTVVTSGDYQRFYIVDGERFSHIIDPETLMPANGFRSVTVVSGESGLADALSTALFILPYDKGKKLAEVEGCEALWLLADGTSLATEGIEELQKKPSP